MTLFLRLLCLALAEGSLQATRQIVRRELDRKGPTIDIPCGPGVLSDLFAGEDYVGCDPCRSDIDAARARRPGVFVCSSADRIDVPEGRFAQVLARDLFDNSADQRARTWASELGRVTAEGGRLLLIGTLPVPRRAVVHRIAARLAGAGVGRTPSALAALLRPDFEVASSVTYRSGFVRRVALVARKTRRVSG